MQLTTEAAEVDICGVVCFTNKRCKMAITNMANNNESKKRVNSLLFADDKVLTAETEDNLQYGIYTLDKM